MRLWSIHPKYLDTKGLVAAWREGLLAKRVLQGRTRGFKNHPQLARFKKAENPVAAVNSYLYFVFREAKKRGYSFDRKKLRGKLSRKKALVGKRELQREIVTLKKKLKARAPEMLRLLKAKKIELNPAFRRAKI